MAAPAFRSESHVVGTGTDATPAEPAGAAAVDTATLAIAIIMDWDGSAAGGWTGPAGYTIRSDNTAGNDSAVATKTLSASGSENPAAFTNRIGVAHNKVVATITLSAVATEQ